MTVTKLSNFLEASHLSPSLIRAVVRQVGGWESFTEIASDVASYGAAGGFSGFCYYSDTVKFSKRNKDEILALCKQMADDLGSDGAFSLIASFNCVDLGVDEVVDGLFHRHSEHETTVFNALAWFALEEVSRSYSDLCGE